MKPHLFILLLLLAVAGTSPAQTLINLNFGTGDRVGLAAAGSGTNDFWNNYYPTNGMGGLYANGLLTLYNSGGTNSGAAILVYNVDAHDTNNVGDAMFDSYLSASSTNLTLSFTNLPFGLYDVYAYAHGSTDALNGIVSLSTAWTNAAQQATVTNSTWTTNVWMEGAQYVVFSNVMVSASSGQNLALTIATNTSGLALLNGLQLFGKSIPTQDTDGDGLTDADELARGTNPYAVDTDGDGVADNIEVAQGRNPLKGAITDTDKTVLKLRVFTPLN